MTGKEQAVGRSFFAEASADNEGYGGFAAEAASQRAAYMRRYRAEHAGEIAAQRIRYRAKNRETIRAACRAYDAAHGEARAARDGRYYREHREQILARHRARYAANRAKGDAAETVRRIAAAMPARLRWWRGMSALEILGENTKGQELDVKCAGCEGTGWADLAAVEACPVCCGFGKLPSMAAKWCAEELRKGEAAPVRTSRMGARYARQPGENAVPRRRIARMAERGYRVYGRAGRRLAIDAERELRLVAK